MPATMSTVDAILKEVYGPRIENQLQNEVVGLKRIERTSDGVTETVGGKYVDFPLRVKRNTGIGYRAEDTQLPDSGQQGYAEVHVPLKYGYGRVRMTGQLMQLADKNYQAFASAMDNEMEYLKDDIAKDSARVFYGDGTGVLTTVNDTASSVTHAVVSTQYLEIGTRVDVYTAAGAVVVSNVLISDISGLNVTFSTTFVGVVGQKIYRYGNKDLEPSGMGLIVDDTATLHTLSPASERKWAATVTQNGGTPRALSEGLMIKMCDDIRVKGGKVSVILTSLGVRRSYFNLLVQQRRYADTKEFSGGFTGLAFNYGKEIPVVEDVDAPPNKMWFLDEDKFKIYRSKEWHWADDDGSVLKWVHDYDRWEGFMRCYWEIGTSQRNAQGILKDVIEG